MHSIFCLQGSKPAISRPVALAAALLALALLGGTPPLAGAGRLDGVNVVAARGHSFGGASALAALGRARELGATAIAIVPFLWQAAPDSARLVRGDDMTDAELRAAIRAARQVSLQVLVKPHVWVEGSWAGAVAPASEPDWRSWFAGYQAELTRIARIAAEEGAAILAIGTELTKTVQRPEWNEVIAAARAAFPGALIYVAHNPEEAERVPFWHALDLIGVTLYPPLGADADRDAGRIAMRAAAERIDTLASRLDKRVLVAEIGIRSAEGAAAKPWESAEERPAKPDTQLQARVLADWLEILDRPSVTGVLVWRWFTDPAAGGPQDTDFTVQGKPAEDVLRCAWTKICKPSR